MTSCLWLNENVTRFGMALLRLLHRTNGPKMGNGSDNAIMEIFRVQSRIVV
jgi:hypothetical protein